MSDDVRDYNAAPPNRVTVVDIDVPMGRIAVFLVKVFVVSMFLGVVVWLVMMIVGGSGGPDRYGP